MEETTQTINEEVQKPESSTGLTSDGDLVSTVSGPESIPSDETINTEDQPETEGEVKEETTDDKPKEEGEKKEDVKPEDKPDDENNTYDINLSF